MQTYAYGFPRLGENREYKKAIENFWNAKATETQTKNELDRLQEELLKIYSRSVDQFPVGEMTAYDPMLDTAIMLGIHRPKNLNDYYSLCREEKALEMTKWFNTNYHYLVTDFGSIKKPKLRLNWNKSMEYQKRFQKGIPYLIGPFTFFKLSKGLSRNRFFDLLDTAADIYAKIIEDLPEVHVDEPAFVLDLNQEEIKAIRKAYKKMDPTSRKINLFTYYESVDWIKDLLSLPVKSLGLDFIHGAEQLSMIKKYGFPNDKTLIAGIVDGRSIWKTNLTKVITLLHELSRHTSSLMISNAAPLYHLPITLKGEKLPTELLQRLSFARERLGELQTIAELWKNGKTPEASVSLSLGVNMTVRKKVESLQTKDFIKKVPYSKRTSLQNGLLRLPPFPTTTIGSFPQTFEIRKLRSDYRGGQISKEVYDAHIKSKIAELIRFQEELGLDVLVHGEFERTDMVEFFAEKLEGIATTQKGWIISYGTRAYRPPIIFGDVSRPQPMTIDEITYAQSLTSKPVKGMLTGPVTIIAWSFVREDIPVSQVAYQIGLALKEEILDYEKKGIKIVQIDEPALREKTPIKRKKWKEYFDWAIKAFRLTTNTDPTTQIHAHMCYSEFGDIIREIRQMDFDVISIETSRSHGDIIKGFEKMKFDRQIGLGVWDIHSPVVPKKKEMVSIVRRALKVIPKENFWINPDCGLKTRNWEETTASLKNLVALSQTLRKRRK